MITYTNGYVANFDGMSPTYFDGTMPVSVYFYIKQDGRDIVVNGESYQASILDPPLLFLFYPNINAYKAVIVTHYGLPQYYEVPLEQHKFLNGAFILPVGKILRQDLVIILQQVLVNSE